MTLANTKASIFIPNNTETNVQTLLKKTTDLCIGAHQDDIEIMAYGAIAACYGKEDRHFTGVTVTDGGGSPRSGVYAHYTDEQMKTVREEEQNSAATIGRYLAQCNLAYPSSAVKDPTNRTIIEELKTLITNTSPTIIYTHNLADKHDTHVAVTMHVIRALRELKGTIHMPRLIGMEVWRALDWLHDEDKYVADNAPFPNLSAALLGVYDSQISGGKRYDLASQGRRLANATFFASHAVDDYELAAFGIDMTDVVENNVDPCVFIEGHIEKFRSEVADRVKLFC